MRKYMKILIAIAVMLTLATPSAGIGKVLAEENDITRNASVQNQAISEGDGQGADQNEPELLQSSNDGNDSAVGLPSSEEQKSAEEDDPEGDPADGDYHEWQTDIDEYDAEEVTTITFILSGADSVKAAIDSDYDADEADVDYSETIRNGDTRELMRGIDFIPSGREKRYLISDVADRIAESRRV